MIKFTPKNGEWPINEDWNWHCGNSNGLFGNLESWTWALDNRYGKSESAEEYLLKSQIQSYEARRAMYEAYARNKYTASTGFLFFFYFLFFEK